MGSMPVQDSQIDVLIVGAGPAGLMAATALTKAGVSVRIVDKRANRVTVGHADGVQPRTVEVLHSYGMIDHIRNNGVQVVMQSFYASTPDSNGIFLGQRAPACIGPPGRGHGITTHQGTIEENFINYLSSAGVEMERSIAPTSLEISSDAAALADPHSHSVTVTLPTPHGGEEIVRAKYVIGGDGARSWVREALSIPMVGENTEYVWGVLDIFPDTNFPDVRHLSVMQSQIGSVLIVPRERGLIRLYVQLENHADLFDANGTIVREKLTADTILDVAARSMKPYKMAAIGKPEWWSVYRIRQQVATRFHEKERVFIVGDACHTHSPKAGQGMNASISDSHNLAWKLAHVLRGWAKPSLLATYEAERRNYALQLISFDKIFSSSVSKRVKVNAEDEGEGITREELMKVVGTFGSFQSGIGIRYESGPLINVAQQALASKLTIGERLPHAEIVNAADGLEHNLQDLAPSNFRYKVLLFAGDVSEEAQRKRLQAAATAVNKRFPQGKEIATRADVHVIGYGQDITDMSVHLQKLPGLDWYRSFADTANAFAPAEGKLHEAFGIDAQGAAIVVRPDGYVSAVGRLDASLEQTLAAYFDVYAA